MDTMLQADVLEHSKEKIVSTGRAMELLGLPGDSCFYLSGNLYWQALEIIARLRAELSREHTGQTCGHCLRFIETSNEGTSYCQACADAGAVEAALRTELDAARETQKLPHGCQVHSGHIFPSDGGACVVCELAQARAWSAAWKSCAKHYGRTYQFTSRIGMSPLPDKRKAE